MLSSSILLNIFYFIIGIAGLIAGGEMLVRGASRFARDLGISPVIVGLTVVAFGTSSPEFVVCLTAALQGASDITVGNIVGSNIANLATTCRGPAANLPDIWQVTASSTWSGIPAFGSTKKMARP